MSRRRPTYKAYIADKMCDVEFVQGVIMAAVESGETVEDAVNQQGI